MAAGGVLTAKQAPCRPGTTPALGLRADRAATTMTRQMTDEARTIPTVVFRAIAELLEQESA